jgi:hypothetical protein
MKKGLIHLAAIAALLTVSFVQAEARDWKILGKDDKKIHYLYEPKSMKIDANGILSVWTSKQINVSGELRPDGLQPYQYGGDRYTVTYQEFNCKEKKVRALTGITYNDRGKAEGDVSKGNFEPVGAGSPDAFLLEGLCKIAQEQQAEQKVEKK